LHSTADRSADCDQTSIRGQSWVGLLFFNLCHLHCMGAFIWAMLSSLVRNNGAPSWPQDHRIVAADASCQMNSTLAGNWNHVKLIQLHGKLRALLGLSFARWNVELNTP